MRVSTEDVAADYRTRLAARVAARDADERRHVRMSRVRLIIAALGVAVLWRLGAGAGPWLAAAAVAFLLAAAWHARILASRDRAGRAVAWYERGLRRLDDAWMGQGDSGEAFRPAGHLYADDLDLFGRGGLFELLSTPRTVGGQRLLAGWLLAPAAVPVVLERQAAVRELAGARDLRETLAVIGEGVRLDSPRLREWALAPSRLPARLLPVPLALFSTATAALLVIYLSTGRFGFASLVLLAVHAGVLGLLRTRVAAVLEAVESPTRDLALLSGLLRTLEAERVEAPALRRLQAALTAEGRRASAEISRLEALVARLAWRRNLIVALPAALLAWGTQSALAIDRWRRRVGPHVPAWLDAAAELEALSALATYADEHPAAVFPAFEEGPARFDAQALAHPLLPKAAVANDVAIGGEAPHILIVSGSNMSGKSTLLRAIGVNVVLAQAGAPVRASACRLTPLAIGASIRVLDSLQEGHSRFFAEIMRLKQLVDLTTRQPGGVLFLLDEILAGTNSHDRAHGATVLLAGLARAGAVGLVTTHDLALSRIADEPGTRAANVHFADRFDAGGLSFDYRLRPGPVRTSNALALMRSIGLDV